MDKTNLVKFIDFLKKKQWQVFGTVRRHGVLAVEELDKSEELVLEPGVPFYSFKRFFVPEYEKLFEYDGAELTQRVYPEERRALFGLNLLDLRSILLYDQVFEKDSYYQARRKNLLVVGHSAVPDVAQNIFEQTFEEDVLEHLSFDIFIASIGLPDAEEGRLYKIFTGSVQGQRILEDFGFKDFTHIQFSGPVKEGKLDERMLKIQDKLKNHHEQQIWDELGKRCIECGKCTIVCPTCFCFRIDDKASLETDTGGRERCWDSCYYQEFSEVAGGHKFLNSTAQRIHFWYYHKFARIPEEFNFMGCVGCRRCAVVCPVGIDIAEVLKSIEGLQ